MTNVQSVTAGEKLAIIDPRPYQINVDKACADLKLAIKQAGATSAGVERAQAAVAR